MLYYCIISSLDKLGYNSAICRLLRVPGGKYSYPFEIKFVYRIDNNKVNMK